MNTLGASLEKLMELELQIKAARTTVIKSIFESCPGLKSFELAILPIPRWMGKSPLSWGVHLLKVNSLEVEKSGDIENLYPLIPNENEKIWAIEANLAWVEYRRLIHGLKKIEPTFFTTKIYQREEYL